MLGNRRATRGKAKTETKKCCFRIVGRRTVEGEEGSFLEPIFFNFTYLYLGPRRYKCSRICLSHNCDYSQLISRSSFALVARELANLPSIVSKIEDKLQASTKDVGKAIIADLPVSESELKKMRSGTGSSFSHVLRLARKVNYFIILLFSF